MEPTASRLGITSLDGFVCNGEKVYCVEPLELGGLFPKLVLPYDGPDQAPPEDANNARVGTSTGSALYLLPSSLPAPL